MTGRGTPGPVAAPARAARGNVSPALPGNLAATASRRWPAPLRLMTVHAHPDDESSKGAATMARYARYGVDVMVCTLTGGERGDILNKAMDRPGIRASLSRVRRQEMARAQEILGVRQQFLGFTDSGLPEGNPLPPLPAGCFALQKLADAAEPLVRAVREFRPHVMVTYDENSGGYPHPDHVMTHQVSVEAFDAAADPDRYPGSGEPWQPLKLYYFVSWFTALYEEVERRRLESPYTEWFKRWGAEGRAAGRPRLEITTRVPCADFFAVRDQALLAHATQIDPRSAWFACPLEVQQAAWPTEDYHLARSLVNASLPEDDLFTGVRETLLVSAAGTPGAQAR
jgi:mycothiol S-conjugate amidase